MPLARVPFLIDTVSEYLFNNDILCALCSGVS
jgi:hypothetical protein